MVCSDDQHIINLTNKEILLKTSIHKQKIPQSNLLKSLFTDKIPQCNLFKSPVTKNNFHNVFYQIPNSQT